MNAPDPSVIERRAAIFALTIGIILLALKFAAYLLTGSAAILSDALESIVNVLAGGFALYSVILAHQPADREHPYGHGKIEFLSASFEGGMIILAAVVIAARAIEKLISPTPVQALDLGLLLTVLAMLINGATGFYLIRLGRRSGSLTLESDGRHLLSDAVTSVVVLVVLGVLWVQPQLTWIDPVAALGVAAYISWMALGLLRRSTAGLMDEQDRRDDELIRGIVDSHVGVGAKEPAICSYHKLRHRHSGRYHWVDIHLVVPADWDVDRAHKVASAIEYEIEQSIGEGNATAHVEPCHAHECKRCALGDEGDEG
jgi:cation diffusion facilitator family transporter